MVTTERLVFFDTSIELRGYVNKMNNAERYPWTLAGGLVLKEGIHFYSSFCSRDCVVSRTVKCTLQSIAEGNISTFNYK